MLTLAADQFRSYILPSYFGLKGEVCLLLQERIDVAGEHKAGLYLGPRGVRKHLCVRKSNKENLKLKILALLDLIHCAKC